jgi:predicted transcriptional regulator of viral defense system
MPPSQPIQEILSLARQTGVLRIRDVRARGLHPEYVRRLVAGGYLIRAGRGIYLLADAAFTVHHSLAEACKRVPHGVVCLLSSLRYHEIGTQNPHQVWLALDVKARLPRADYPPLKVVRFSGQALKEGVDLNQIEGVDVRVYNPAKTVADCFKYRNKIGLDVALEALREGWRARRFAMDDLWRYAKVDRVTNVMRPYLEALG